MSAFTCDVCAAYGSQSTICDPYDREHCSGDPEKLATIGCAVGSQIRVVRDASNYAIYTVSEERQETPDKIIRMCQIGREKLGTSDPFDDGTVDSLITRSNLTDQQAENQSEFVERLTDNSGEATDLLVLAPHGGSIESYTDEQAERVCSQLSEYDVSSWRCKGWKSGGGAYNRWHIRSNDIDPASFPLLSGVWDLGWEYAVAFHGYSGSDILIGGLAPCWLKCDICKAVQTAVGAAYTVRVAKPSDDPYDGGSTNNIINRVSDNGVQLEQPYGARSGYWQDIADAVASVFEDLL